MPGQLASVCMCVYVLHWLHVWVCDADVSPLSGASNMASGMHVMCVMCVMCAMCVMCGLDVPQASDFETWL